MTARTAILQLVLAAAFIIPAVNAASLAEYKASIAEARSAVYDLENYLYESESYDRETEARLAARIRSSLEPSRRVEIRSGTIETSDEWLARRVDAYVAESDSMKKTVILAEIGERLDAVTGKITELEEAQAAENTKDEDKRRLSEILRRAEYQPPAEKKESAFDKWLADFLSWLDSLLPSAPKPSGAPGGVTSIAWGLQIFLYALIAVLIGFGVYKLAPVIFPKLKRKPREKREDRVVLGERIAEDESSHDLFMEAERLAKSGDSRGAIRKGYVAVLCELSDRKLIGLARHKTNRDYLRDVRRQPAVHSGLSGVTDLFERHWYGFGDSKPEDWENFRTRCTETITKA